MASSHHSISPACEIGEENRDESVRQVKKSLRPLFAAMKAFGLYFGDAYCDVDLKENAVAPLNETCASKRVSWKEKFGKTYCGLVCLLLYVGFACSFSFTVRSGDYFTIARRLTIDIWVLWSALQGTVTVLSLSRREHGSKFSKFMKALAIADSNGVPHSCRLPTILTAIFIGTICFNFTVSILLMNFPLKEVRNSMLVAQFGKDNMTVTGPDGWIVVLSQVTLPFTSAAWGLPSCFYIVSCIVIAERFSFLTKKTQMTFNSDDNFVNITLLRRDHLRLCHALEKLDEILSPLALVSYGCSIPEICITLDVVIRMSREGSDYFIIMVMVFWNLVNISNTVVTSLIGAHVNVKAHSLTSIVYEVDGNKLKDGEKNELLLLLNKLNTEVISPTIGGIIPVTRGMLLTVFGTIIGYLTILVQFK
ncbi:uncharacterized protein LOC116613959 isoform X2 [Nematostella vectensis]|nr:uncharacterized protein LOC116613959 isoform X2 [Nematostella vectensis]XP_048575360.1 uncharacterized protein LOC116613959 isoform X2 [Nematostella vectensis]XP_048575361.1 uncharacterized protein LOC116613959 isoform X2 [Nematostella vectensis]